MPDTERGLARRALAVNQANLALGHEMFTVDGGTFVRNAGFPRIMDANHVADITASTPEEIERLLARVETEFAHCTHRKFHADFTTPPAFEARLVLDGYKPTFAIVMLLEGDLRTAAKLCDIRPINGAAGWDAFHELHAADWLEYTRRIGNGVDDAAGVAMAHADAIKSPPVRYWLVYDDGAPRGYLNSWAGIDGVGQVESLFVQAEYRHRGLATALIHHCVADAREHGAGPVVIVADASDTPKQMYAAMGFRPVAIKRTYLKVFG